MKAIEFKQYRRKGLSEMIPFSEFVGQDMSSVSVSEQDKLLSVEEFQKGYIARNPKNHADMWYVAKKYFDDNLEPASHVQSELSKTNAGYWRKMYELSRNIIHKLNIGQTYEYMPEAVELEAMEDQSEPHSELSTKIAEIEKTFTDRKVRPLDPVWKDCPKCGLKMTYGQLVTEEGYCWSCNHRGVF